MKPAAPDGRRVRHVMTNADVADALEAARLRGAVNRSAGRMDRKICEDGRAIDAIGAIAEKAWSSYAGVPWDARLLTRRDMGLLRGGWDVCGVHLRATSIDCGCLLCYDKDPDDGPFVLAIVNLPAVTFAGWMLAMEAKLRTPRLPPGRVCGRPAYMVPQSELRHVSELLPRTAKAYFGQPHLIQRHPAAAPAFFDVPSGGR